MTRHTTVLPTDTILIGDIFVVQLSLFYYVTKMYSIEGC